MTLGSKENKRDMERSLVSELSDDLLVEIISRVPYKSTCCCKCVSKRWRGLISDLDHRKKLPRSTLAGFFYEIYDSNRHPYMCHGYQSVSGDWCPHINSPLSFLPKHERLDLLDCCNGLLLCGCWERKSADHKIFYYMVCNLATEKWVAVPATELSREVLDARLGFDPTVSSHFHVFEFVPADIVEEDNRGDSTHIKAVGIYSSKAGDWTQRSAWDRPIDIRKFPASAFFNGVMYLTTYGNMVLAAVDVEGNNRLIAIPTQHADDVGFDVYLSRGQLHLAYYGASGLSIWPLEDPNSENWTLKHKVSHLQLFGKEHSPYVQPCSVIIHPEENVIFILCMRSYTGRPPLVMELRSYEMDSRELRFIRDLEWGCVTPFLQYVPFLSQSLADGP